MKIKELKSEHIGLQLTAKVHHGKDGSGALLDRYQINSSMRGTEEQYRKIHA